MRIKRYTRESLNGINDLNPLICKLVWLKYATIISKLKSLDFLNCSLKQMDPNEELCLRSELKI